MGQTLNHGVYLPAEGERNCYSGLASNWNLLDTAIGDIAGKASATHTHGNITDDGKVGTTANKPLITGTGGVVQAGSFGNQANTFCEGNDSRLSDARTPVAHTHGKADITDLFNSANTWSAVNQYSREIQLAGDRNSFIAPMWEGAGSGMAFLVSDASKAICFGIYTDDANNNNRKIADGTKGRMIIRVGEKNSETYLEVEPRASNAALGNSSSKWKTINGINPGALSLPDCQVTQSIDRTGWVYDGATYNTVLLATTDTNMTKNGWLYVRMANTTSSDKLTVKYNSTADRYPANTFGDAGGCIEAFVPVVADTNIYVLATKDLSFCKFYPCLGNVPSGV